MVVFRTVPETRAHNQVMPSQKRSYASIMGSSIGDLGMTGWGHDGITVVVFRRTVTCSNRMGGTERGKERQEAITRRPVLRAGWAFLVPENVCCCETTKELTDRVSE